MPFFDEISPCIYKRHLLRQVIFGVASQTAEWLKKLPAMWERQEMQVRPQGQEDPLEEAWQPSPGECYEQRSLQATVHKVEKIWKWLKQLSTHTQYLE